MIPAASEAKQQQDEQPPLQDYHRDHYHTMAGARLSGSIGGLDLGLMAKGMFSYPTSGPAEAMALGDGKERGASSNSSRQAEEGANTAEERQHFFSESSGDLENGTGVDGYSVPLRSGTVSGGRQMPPQPLNFTLQHDHNDPSMSMGASGGARASVSGAGGEGDIVERPTAPRPRRYARRGNGLQGWGKMSGERGSVAWGTAPFFDGGDGKVATMGREGGRQSSQQPSSSPQPSSPGHSPHVAVGNGGGGAKKGDSGDAVASSILRSTAVNELDLAFWSKYGTNYDRSSSPSSSPPSSSSLPQGYLNPAEDPRVCRSNMLSDNGNRSYEKRGAEPTDIKKKSHGTDEACTHQQYPYGVGGRHHELALCSESNNTKFPLPTAVETLPRLTPRDEGEEAGGEEEDFGESSAPARSRNNPQESTPVAKQTLYRDTLPLHRPESLDVSDATHILSSRRKALTDGRGFSTYTPHGRASSPPWPVTEPGQLNQEQGQSSPAPEQLCQADHQQHSSAALAPLKDDDVITSLLARRTALATTLSHRLMHLRLLGIKWRAGDVVGAVEHLEELSQMVMVESGENSQQQTAAVAAVGSGGSSDRNLIFGILVDFFGRVSLDHCRHQMTLDLSQRLLPLLSRLIGSVAAELPPPCSPIDEQTAEDLTNDPRNPSLVGREESKDDGSAPWSTLLLTRRALVATKPATALLKLFGRLIQEGRLLPRAVGIDMNQEQRQKRCIMCYTSFAHIKDNVHRLRLSTALSAGNGPLGVTLTDFCTQFDVAFGHKK